MAQQAQVCKCKEESSTIWLCKRPSRTSRSKFKNKWRQTKGKLIVMLSKFWKKLLRRKTVMMILMTMMMPSTQFVI